MDSRHPHQTFERDLCEQLGGAHLAAAGDAFLDALLDWPPAAGISRLAAAPAGARPWCWRVAGT
eukprot:9599283-Alexandrium_andersonii.AAC.1